jgi:hypothetical protein
LFDERFKNPPFFPGQGQTIFAWYVLICWGYYTVCVFVSHRVYKEFKALVMEVQQTGYGMMQGGMMGGGYEMQSSRPGRVVNQPVQQQQQRSYFQGQGVTVG